ncbi:NIPSNAP family protein [Chelativorans sp. J32]|uniref:NIPSNAP family protein n=1 Tax=Chelativorans sp. J32 TaxID=935840 RepID=UPI0004836DE1|nr:NIPSNAP family protein [Chelativorans sp. J32]
MSLSVQQNVIELRRYLLHPRRREDLITLFDRHLVESQEECGMSVLGQFRDLDRPDDFVWLRGFSDMDSRRHSLASFYDGPLWAAHRDEANATMERFDDVLLLHPVGEDTGFALAGVKRPFASGQAEIGTVFALYTFPLVPERADDFPAYFSHVILPVLVEAGAPAGARLETEQSKNTFPRLPVRDKERVFVWIGRFDSRAEHHRFARRLHSAPGWQDAMANAFESFTNAPVSLCRLAPTARSLLH